MTFEQVKQDLIDGKTVTDHEDTAFRSISYDKAARKFVYYTQGVESHRDRMLSLNMGNLKSKSWRVD